MNNDIIEKLWTAVCCNDIEFIRNYYTNGGKANIRYSKSEHDNSLIMGALRNKNYEMVEILKQNGETLLANEVEEYKSIMVVYKYQDELTQNVEKNSNG